MRIESISLDLCIGNKASLVWVGQDHFFHRLKFLELIVDQTPIPACFNDGFAWPFQTGKKLRKPSCAIAFDSSLAQLPPALIQRAQHAVLLVDIYSDVVHENSFLSSSSLRTEMLLSCYLSPKFPGGPSNSIARLSNESDWRTGWGMMFSCLSAGARY